ncbi:Kinesin-like protein Klp68D [Halotydeus destructor]|nr:Kinesin-like protein Klp68D [Halotydeus destructor]
MSNGKVTPIVPSPVPILPKTPSQECVKVVVRCRPMHEKEIAEEHERVVEMFLDRGVIELKCLTKASEPAKQFTFDAVYDWNSKQSDLYDETARPLVNAVLDGFNCTIFAYGQTGTGKTYTMEGLKNDPEKRGIIPSSFEHIFNHIARSQNQQYLVRGSYLEIYQEEVRDLLAKDQTKRLEVKEAADVGVYVKDLSSFVCKSIKEIEHVMTIGNQNRAVGATNMNEHSSRSHAIFIINVEHSEVGADKETHIRVGKLNLVDLAGSERQAKTGAVGQRQKEAIKINLSLSALGNVISALVDGKSTHIPYRDSKLTRLLQDSLGGNSKTVMVANVGPASYNYEETLTTLRYASRAKNIKNKPRVNEDPKDAILREFQQEIDRLKSLLTEKKKRKDRGNSDADRSTPVTPSNENLPGIDVEASEKLNSQIKALESKLLSGGKNIVDHTNEQQLELERRQQEIAEKTRIEREMRQQLEAKEESTVEVKETFSSLQHEVEMKKKKLRKLFNKLQSVKAEIKDTQESNARERRELEELQGDLMKELKLKYLIIDNFIQPEEKSKLLSKVIYDEEEDDWKLIPMQASATLLLKRPISSPKYHRPTSEYSKIAATVGPAFRYKGENILDVDLIMPVRTTKDYTAPIMSPSLRAALDSALQNETEVSIDASDITSPCDHEDLMKRIKSVSRPKSTRPKTSSSRRSNGQNGDTMRPLYDRPDTANHFPESRGLIQRR